jgi:hypothetical protein
MQSLSYKKITNQLETIYENPIELLNRDEIISRLNKDLQNQENIITNLTNIINKKDNIIKQMHEQQKKDIPNNMNSCCLIV